MKDKILEIIVGILMFPAFILFGLIRGTLYYYITLHECFKEEER